MLVINSDMISTTLIGVPKNYWIWYGPYLTFLYSVVGRLTDSSEYVL